MKDRLPKNARAAYPKSPCVDMCTLDDHDVCIGCARSLEEIIRWGAMTAAEQWQLLRALAERRRQ